jgi:hypothetical protein
MKSQYFVDESLAKGIRRTISRQHQKLMDGTVLPEENIQKSWNKCVEMFLAHYKKVAGLSNVKLLKKTNNRFEFLVVIDGQKQGVGVVCHLICKKKTSEETVQETLDNHVPISFTPHFHERYIQLPDDVASPLVSVMDRLRIAIRSEFFVAIDGNGDLYPFWRKTGNFAFADGKILIFGNVEVDKSLLCRTVIRADRLEESKEKLFRVAASAPNKFVFY